METQTRFEYYAFISYSHKDKKWAEWLQHKLEHYKIPTSLHKSSDGKIPKKIYPIFRDQTDLGVGSLEFNLRKELTDSRYLIVVCSPDSAKSDWVNKEIEHFKQMGREDRIIPFIVSGEPNADNDSECYPPGLKETDILGIRLSEKKEKEALIQIVAKLLELDFDTLWEREIQEQKSRKKRNALIGGALAALIGICSWAYWDYNFHEKVGYFSNYVEIYGVANGIDALTQEQASKRNLSYRITELKGEVISFEKVNGSGYLCGGDTVALDSDYLTVPDMPAKIEYAYNENESLNKATYYRKNGLHIVTLEYISPEVANIYMSEKTAEGGWNASQLSVASTSLSNESKNNEINRFVFEYDDQGKTTKKSFYNMYNIARRNENGVCAEVYSYDDKDRLITTEYADDIGNPSADKYGVHGINFERNVQGEITKIQYYDLNKGEAMSSKLYSKVELIYENGNITEEKYSFKNRFVNNWAGFAIAYQKYDVKGNIEKISYCGVNKELVLSSDGAASWVSKYDEKGNQIKISYYGINDEPILGIDGVASWEMKYDEMGNEISCSFYGVNEELVLGSEGYASWVSKYDEMGNEISCSFYGVNSEPILGIDGVALRIYNYDEKGNLINVSCFGVKCEPILGIYGAASWEMKYDEMGNKISCYLYGINGELVLGSEGAASQMKKYDDKGNLINVNYYGINGEPVLGSEGYASRKAEYDEKGKQINVSYLGVNGEPILEIDGYTSRKAEYDEKGKLIKVSYFGVNGEPILGINGYASEEDKYDNKGKLIGCILFGVNGEPILGINGYASREMKYDDKGNQIKISYYGINGEPVLGSEGYASRETEYDEKGNEISCSYYGVNGEPVS